MRMAREYRDEEILGMLEPYVAEWFRRKYKVFTPPQRYAIPPILRGKNILISAPTGSGKTLACFLGIIDYLCKLRRLEDKIYALYVSPLRALGNDIRRNLVGPLEEIRIVAAEMGEEMPEIRVETRTGDTPTSEKQRMLRKPPHILITTPESAAIVLNAPKFSRYMDGLKYVIVDEIHELVDSKRGAHLSITLARIEEGRKVSKIGMSATISPIEEVAKFLVGYNDEGELNECLIADVSFAKSFDIEVVSPLDDLVSAGGAETTEELYKCIKRYVSNHRSVLIFTNTRSGAERVSYHLSKLFRKNEGIGTHHGSLSREARITVEEKLKHGMMRAVACSSSLELGIDIGALDLCIQVGSPKSITRLIQRIGRSGHELHRVARGKVIVLDRDDLVEATVLAKCALERKLDRVQIVGAALDVLAQHIVGMSLSKKWRVWDAYDLIRRAYPYRSLSYDQLLSVLRYLSGHELEGRGVYPKIWFSENDGVFGRKGGSVRGIYMTHVGTIPSETHIQVYFGKKWIGEIDEPFLEKLCRGDIFVLGGKTWEFKGVAGTRAYVEDATGKSPTIPSWIGEMLPLSYDSAIEVGKFREEMERRMGDGKKCLRWLREEYNLSARAARQIYEYFSEQMKYIGIIPTHRLILVEEYVDEDGCQNIIVHSIFGRRTNDALSRAYAYKVGKEYRTNVAVTVNDNGFVLRLPEDRHIDPRVLPGLVRSDEMEEILRKALANTELLKRRFRHCAVRSLMVLKEYKGYEIRIGKQQRSSDSLLRAARTLEKFPVLEEAYREILEEVMDLPHAKEVVRGIEMGDIKFEFVRVPVPSPFSHNLITLQAADVVLMESRKEFLLQLHRKVLEHIKRR